MELDLTRHSSRGGGGGRRLGGLDGERVVDVVDLRRRLAIERYQLEKLALELDAGRIRAVPHVLDVDGSFYSGEWEDVVDGVALEVLDGFELREFLAIEL